MPLVGSSSTMVLKPFMHASATDNLRFMPPEKLIVSPSIAFSSEKILSSRSHSERQVARSKPRNMPITWNICRGVKCGQK